MGAGRTRVLRLFRQYPLDDSLRHFEAVRQLFCVDASIEGPARVILKKVGLMRSPFKCRKLDVFEERPEVTE
jgi:hypothetical protein